MIHYIFLASLSTLALLQLKKYFYKNFSEFSYFISVNIIIFLSYLLLLFEIYNIILIFKIILIILFFFDTFYKKIRLTRLDLIFLAVSLFLLYFCYNLGISKSDILLTHGLNSKYIFIYKDLPYFDKSSFFIDTSGSYTLSIFHNFFLYGSNFYLEEISVYAHNIFLISAFMCFFSEKFLSKNSNLKILLIFICFYLLNNIFGQGGINIFLDEASILTYFFIIIFFYKKFTFSSYNIFIIVLLITSAILIKKTHIHFLLIPLFIYCFFFSERKKIIKYLPIIFLLPILLFYFQNLALNNHNKNKKNLFFDLTNIEQTKSQNTESNKHLSIESGGNIKNAFFDYENFKFSFFGTYCVIDCYKTRFNNFIKDEEIKKNMLEKFNKLLNVEVYKASLFPILRYALNNYSNFEMKRISITYKIWFVLFSIYMIYFFVKKNKEKRQNFIFLILYFFFIFNFFLVLENEIRNSEIFYKDSNNIIGYELINSNYDATDYSRHLGTGAYLLLLFLFYSIKNYPEKYIYIFLFFLIIITPARSLGFLAKHPKIFPHKQKHAIEIFLDKQARNEDEKSLFNKCLQSGTFYVYDNEQDNKVARYYETLKYFYIDKKITSLPIDLINNKYSARGYNHLTVNNFKNLKSRLNFGCIFVTSDDHKTNNILEKVYDVKKLKNINVYNNFFFK